VLYKNEWLTMLWDLIKFKIRTTFRKTIIFAVILILLLQYSQPHSNVPQSEVYEYDYIISVVGVVFIIFYFLLYSWSTSLNIQKSDVDFLYMLPLDDKEIFVAQTISSLLLSLVPMIIIVYLLFPVLSFLSILVVLMLSVVNAFSYFAFKKHRKVASAIITVWMLSSILKFPFTPLSMLFGYVYGYFILAGLDVIVLFLGIRNAKVEDFVVEFYKRQNLLTKGERPTTSITLYSSSPFVAMFKRNLNFLEYGGRVTVGGIPQQISGRTKLYKVLIVTYPMAVIFYVVFSLLSRDTHFAKDNLYFTEDYIVGFMVYFFVFMYSLSAFINEPLWLDLSVMTPLEYARKYLLTKTLSLYVIFLPLLISLFLLNPVGGAESLLTPLTYIFISSVYARLYPSPQSQYGFGNFIAGRLAMTALIPIFLDFLFPIAGAVVTLVLTLPFLLSRGYWEKTFEIAISSI